MLIQLLAAKPNKSVIIIIIIIIKLLLDVRRRTLQCICCFIGVHRLKSLTCQDKPAKVLMEQYLPLRSVIGAGWVWSFVSFTDPVPSLITYTTYIIKVVRGVLHIGKAV